MKSSDHAAEVHADELAEQAINGVGFVDIVLLANLVGELRASFEGETLRLAESVVTVEEDVLDLSIE